jgi:hypothetical protein
MRDAGTSSPFWGHQLNTGTFDFRIVARKPILEVGVGTERLCSNSITVDRDPNNRPDVIADILHLPFPDRYFGLAIAHEVFCVHTKEEQKRMVTELWRVSDALYLRQWKKCGWCIFGRPRCGFKFGVKI